MNISPEFDQQNAHKYFSTTCFNHAWELMDKADRSPAEDEEMVLLSQASFWHWTQREDCTPTNLSIGYWQLARIYTLRGQFEIALRYGQRCLEHSQGAAPFYAAYGYEALARTAARSGAVTQARAYLDEAWRLANQVGDAEDRESIMKDLETIQPDCT